MRREKFNTIDISTINSKLIQYILDQNKYYDKNFSVTHVRNVFFEKIPVKFI